MHFYGFFFIYQPHFIAISNILHDYVFYELPANFTQLFPTNSQFHGNPTPHNFDFSFEL
jgi:hypothetical protein